MDWLLDVVGDPTRWSGAVVDGSRMIARWASAPGSIPYLLGAFAVAAAPCLIHRRWLSALAVALCMAAAYAALVPPSALCSTFGACVPGSVRLVPFGLVLLGSLLVGLDVVRSSRALRAAQARLHAREANISSLDEKLAHERFWRHAAGDERPVIPHDDVLELARRIQEPVVAQPPRG